jgi:hypothetical protein
MTDDEAWVPPFVLDPSFEYTPSSAKKQNVQVFRIRADNVENRL